MVQFHLTDPRVEKTDRQTSRKRPRERPEQAVHVAPSLRAPPYCSLSGGHESPPQTEVPVLSLPPRKSKGLRGSVMGSGDKDPLSLCGAAGGLHGHPQGPFLQASHICMSEDRCAAWTRGSVTLCSAPGTAHWVLHCSHQETGGGAALPGDGGARQCDVGTPVTVCTCPAVTRHTSGGLQCYLPVPPQ